jgi:hypothetical protein
MGIFDLLEHAGDEAFGEKAVAKVIPPSKPKPRKGAQDQQPLQGMRFLDLLPQSLSRLFT